MRTAPLVGREHEISLMVDEADRARRGDGRCLLLVGEAGVGKSRLVADVLSRSAAFEVFQTSAREIERERPFGAIFEALGVRHSSEDSQRAEIARLLRTSADAGRGLRFRIADDLVELVERLSLARPVAIALDDLHWADDGSILAFHGLLSRIASLPVLLVGAYRPHPRPKGLDDIDKLVADGRGRVVRVGSLADDAVFDIATHLLDREPGPRLRERLSGVAGNPFFATELIAALDEDGAITTAEGRAEVAGPSIPPELRMVILRRLANLSRETLTELRVAAVLGSTFVARELAVVMGVRPTAVVDALDEALKSSVLTADGELLRFRHDLVHEALLGDLSPSVVSALHLQTARALASDGARPERVAVHYAAGASPGDEDAIESLRDAARSASSTSPAAAAGWLSRALELVSDDGRDDIIAELAPLLANTGQIDRADELIRDAMARPQPPQRRAALARALAVVLEYSGRGLDAVELLETESASADLPEHDGLLLEAQAASIRTQYKPFASEEAERALLERVTAAGDDYAICLVLYSLFATAWVRGDAHEALSLAQRALAHARRTPKARELGVEELVGISLALVDEHDDARSTLTTALADAESSGLRLVVANCTRELARVDFWEGRWDDAISQTEAGIHVLEESGAAVALPSFTFLATIAARRGEPDRAAAILGDRSFSGKESVAAAILWEIQGDRTHALDVLRSYADTHIPRNYTRWVLEYALHAVRLEMEIGDARRADAVASAARHAADIMGTSWADAIATMCGSAVDDDAEAALDAVTVARRSPKRSIAAEVAEDAAALLVRSDRAAEATPLLLEALEFYDAADAAWDVARAEAALRSLGAPRGKRGARDRPARGWESLTSTEQSVVELAAEALTNAQIGARLFISGRTVERHLTHIYAKLGISSRVELAALAASRRSHP